LKNYFSSKLREVRQALEGKPIINMELKPRLAPSQSVIDAVKLALEDENAHQSELSGIARIAKSMADFI
jgi:aspartate/methionine/tyrosine aminotransferase